MKPNEIVGSIFLVAMVMTLLSGFFTEWSVWHLVGVGVLGIIANIFLSLWGLWTFNPWIASLRPQNKP